MAASWPMLTTLLALPLAGAGVAALARTERLVRQVALAFALAEAALAVALALAFDPGVSGFQFVEKRSWIPALNIAYHLGVDGLSLTMIVLTAALGPLCVLVSWRSADRRVREFHVCLLAMTAFCVGVFAALDLVLFYVFWEAMLVPMFLLIAVWGGPGRRYAALKFFLYTLAGSALLLAAVVAFYVSAGTFSIPELMATDFPARFQALAFAAMALAFAVKMPMVPFHTWLPAAHVEAPTAGSAILAAVLLKMGSYGFIRFCLGLTPQASLDFAPFMCLAALVSIVYGSFVALGQTDIKKLIAYSSVGHMGFVVLGIFVLNRQGLEGAAMQMINHGVTAGALFMCVGILYERTHSRQVANNSGLGRWLPAYMFFLGLFSLAALGFPGTNGFVGEALVLIGAFDKATWMGLAAVPGALLGAAYMLRLLQKMAWGEPSKGKGLADLCLREAACLTVPAVFVLVLGLAPGFVLRVLDGAVSASLAGPQRVLNARLDQAGAADAAADGASARDRDVRTRHTLGAALDRLRVTRGAQNPPESAPDAAGGVRAQASAKEADHAF